MLFLLNFWVCSFRSLVEMQINAATSCFYRYSSGVIVLEDHFTDFFRGIHLLLGSFPVLGRT